LEDLGVEDRIIIKWSLNKQGASVDWIELVQDRIKLWAFVNLRVPRKAGIFLLTKELPSNGERLIHVLSKNILPSEV
jgi:hypothetical protein